MLPINEKFMEMLKEKVFRVNLVIFIGLPFQEDYVEGVKYLDGDFHPRKITVIREIFL